MVNFNITTFPPCHLPFLYLPLKIPLLFLFFLYFFHCLLLPLHSPINSSLTLLTNSHPKGEGQTLLPFSSLLTYISSHLFHSLVFRVFKTSRRRIRRCHHHHQPSTNITTIIFTSSSRLWIACFQGFKDPWSSSSSCFAYGVIHP